MSARLPLLAVAALLTFGGCDRTRPDGAASSPASGAVATLPRAPAQTAIAAVPARAVRHAIVDAGGLAIGRNPGSARYFPFGAPRALVDAAADEWLGAAERTANAECGAGPMAFTRHGGLTLSYRDGKLAGWLLRQDSRAITSDGIAPGRPLRDLEVSRSVRMIGDSTLEGEFDYLAADGRAIGGFASGEGRDAVVESLYGGTNCFFR